MIQSSVIQDDLITIDKQDVRFLSLVDLVRRIVDLKDREALHEFHTNRTVFELKDGRCVRLIDFVQKRFFEMNIENYEINENAKNMVLDKFSNIPNDINSETFTNDRIACCIDCRNYFRSFLTLIETKLHDNEMGELSEEDLAAKLLQGLVERHIHLSILECNRNRDNGFSRYDWVLNGYRIILYFPVYMKGTERREWLESNIPDVDPENPDEKKRIQSIINARFERQVNLVFKSNWDTNDDLTYSNVPSNILQLIDSDGLGYAIAEEKCEKIKEQRESIEKLGKEKLKELILRIFHSISSDQYNLSELAREYSISKSTLSRFAAKNWVEKQKGIEIPDLWLNTCQVLSQHPDFIEAAINAGVWQDVLGFLADSKSNTEANHG